MIPADRIKKEVIFLALEDILVVGRVDESVNRKKVGEILGNLHSLEEKGSINLILVTGLNKENAIRRINEAGLDSYFKKENIYYVTDEYINSKEEIDRERHRMNLENDPNFNDDYFKQLIIGKFIEKGIPREEMLLVGHDLWTDGFYTMKFSGIDFALIKDSLSEKHTKARRIIKGLIYIRRDWKDFRKLLLWKFKKPDYRFLESHVYSELKQDLFGSDLGDLVKRVVVNKKPG